MPDKDQQGGARCQMIPMPKAPRPPFIFRDGQVRNDAQAGCAVSPFPNGAGHGVHEAHTSDARSTLHNGGGLDDDDTLNWLAPATPCEGEQAQDTGDTQSAPDLPALLSSIKETHRRRVDLMRASNRLTLQIKAIARRLCNGDKTEANEKLLPALEGKGEHPKAPAFLAWCQPLLDARATIEEHRKAEEKVMEKQAKQLPIAAWVSEQKGLGWLSVAGLIGEIGDPGNYDNPAKIWKRMGLAVIRGQRQRRVSSPEGALEHGYSPERRSLMWNIGAGLIKQQSPWRDLYLHRLAVEHAKALEEGLTPATTTKATVESWEKRGLPPLTRATKLTEAHRGAGHMHNRAQRYVEKRLLKELWKAWRSICG